MKRLLLSAAILIATVAFLVIAGGASSGSTSGSTYKIELDNAFGVVTGADFRVAGVRAGSIKSLDLCSAVKHSGCQNALHALVTVNVTEKGFGSFRSDVFCQSRPQSLIGEYFIDCDPGHSGQVLKSGSTIPISRTESTIPQDLVNDILRLPYRQRFSLIFNELGAGVASRSEDLKDALRRAVPALTQTDNLLKVLADDSHTLQQLTANSDAVVTALSNNRTDVQRFVREANRNATATAAQQGNLQATFQKLPAFLEELKPRIQQLGAASDANTPSLANLNAASTGLARLFTDLPGFAQSSIPAIKSLGQASVTGKVAVQAAGPTVQHLNQFAKPLPELAQNLAIVLHDLDDRSRAVERTPTSPGNKGFTGLEALLQYVFDQGLAINTFGQFGHLLNVDTFLDPRCSFYASAQLIAINLQHFGPSYRHCYAWLGPNQPGVNEPDPTNPGACVPDPGGAPPGEAGPRTSACKLTAAEAAKQVAEAPVCSSSTPPAFAPDTGTASAAAVAAPGCKSPATTARAATASGGSGTSASAPTATTARAAQQSVSQVVSALNGGSGAPSSPNGAPSNSQAQQLLNYLLAP